MSANEREKIADIVAKFREMVHKSVDGIIAVKADVIADRIEAELERETVSRHSIKIPIVMPPYNMAAMREALVKTSQFLSKLGEWLKVNDEGQEYALAAGMIHTLVEHALSAPPRNCDVGTVEEQAERFSRFCQSAVLDVCSKSCTLYNHSRSLDDCAIQWAQMPYEEGGAE